MATDAADFRYTYPFRFIVPLALIATWLSVVYGPFLYPLLWLVTICIVQVLYTVSAIAQARRALRAASEAIDTIGSAVARETAAATTGDRPDTSLLVDSGDTTDDSSATTPFYHAFVIPNYKEPLELLEATLSTLSKHPAAKSRYLIILAMESAEPAHDTKAKHLATTFCHDFHTITYTAHTLTPPEARGKASNVSHAVSHFADRLLPAAIAADDVLVTVLDADALVHRFYTEELDRVVAGMEWDGGEEGGVRWTVFAPPVLFERNWRAVAAPTRVLDFSWAAMALQNIAGASRLGFPLSVYTIPLRLCIDMGFWDTTDEGIAEDYHTFLKAFFKSKGKVNLCPIYIPVNLVNIQEDGWLKTCYARAVQSERHSRGVIDLAYTCRHALPNLHQWRYWIMLVKVFETQFLPPVVPWFLMVAGPVCQLFQCTYGLFSGPQVILLAWVQTVGIVGLAMLVVTIGSFERVRRYTNAHLYNRSNPSPLSFFQYAWLAVNVWVFVVPPFIIASFRWILPVRQPEYKVAAKKIDFAGELREDDGVSSDSSLIGGPLDIVVEGGALGRDSSPGRNSMDDNLISDCTRCSDSINDPLEQLLPSDGSGQQFGQSKEKRN